LDDVSYHDNEEPPCWLCGHLHFTRADVRASAAAGDEDNNSRRGGRPQ
jgi:hypothetical protein